MAKEKKLTLADLPNLRNTLFTDGELRRKEWKKKNNHCPYRIKRVWNAETQKYEKIKIYRTKKTFTKKEMKERFNGKGVTIVKMDTTVHAKSDNFSKKRVVRHMMRGLVLEWDSETLRYKAAA